MERKCNILYVEDENWQVVGTSVTVLKRRVNAEVTIATDISKARNCLETIHFDVVIFDIMMNPSRPLTFEESALVVVQELLDGKFEPTNPKHTPILFATAVWDMNATKTETSGRRIQKAIRDMVNEIGIENPLCILKPFTAGELVAKVEEALRYGRSRTSNN